MLRTLLESRPHRARTRSAAVASLVIHAALVGTAVAATRTVAGTFDSPPPPPPPPIYVHPGDPRPEPAPPRAPEPEPPAEPAPAPAPAPPTIPAPVAPPDGVHAPDPGAAPAGPVIIGSTALPGASGLGEPGGDPTGSAGAEPMWFDEVEEAARPVGRQREPRYPEALRAQRIEGGVTIRFIVDSLGRVEPASIVALESTHPLFEPAVRAALLQQRFRPARWRGGPVRQLVQQRFVFALAR